MQYTEIFEVVKIENLVDFFFYFSYFLIFAQNIHCGYTLEPPRRGGSNEYPQCMFRSKNKKIGIPLHTPVLLYIKMGFNGVFIARTCFPDDIYFVLSL